MDKKRIMQNKTDVQKVSQDKKKFSELKELVSKFSDNIDQYKRPDYKEARTRVDFIDKFFELLDWDLSNKQGFSEAYRDVIREDEVRIEGKQKAPDYCFKIGVEKKFFVEAKKPSVNIKDDIGAAYQLRRYAYSAKLPLSILTDFHELAIYDTRIKPRPKDNASVARIFYCQFDEYEKNFDYIYNIFSKNAILKGSFDRYVADNKKKKGTSEVDKEFLKLIESWRSELAKNIAVNNKKLDLYNLNTSVQKIIDRIIFLRIAEARNIEEYDNLSKIAENGNVYKKLDDYFQLSDKRYNSGLFAIENWLSDLKIDDKILKDIIKSTYYPESPYEFSVLPVEILGNIYEQFLGKVIHLTASHQAKIEEKPEVKKAGGVYYTPQYIVNYIVKNTVGEKIKDSTPEKIEKIKILDPACGSGSFLLGAYGYLLHWHLNYYTRDKKSLEKYKKAGKIYDYKGDFKLTIDEKKKILKNNIFGVDIDSQAVEVTKLSLLLKLMEDETQQSAGMLIKYSHEALLPNLERNIKCGNSLIGNDFYGSKNMSLFGNDEMRKVNAFDWQKEFKDIFDNGGFDVVIGNPPYGASLDDEQKKYLHALMIDIPDYETSNYFMLKSWDLLSADGLLSFIVPNTFLANKFGINFRKLLLNKYEFLQIQDLSNIDVFEEAKVRTAIIIFEKTIKAKEFKCALGNFSSKLSNIGRKELVENINNWLTLFTLDSNLLDILKDIRKDTYPLGEFTEISQGLIPYDKYRGHSEETIKNRIWHSDHKKDDTCRKELRGGDVNRYILTWNGKNWISYGDWLAAPRKIEFFKNERILIREITSPRILAAYTQEEYYNNPSIINIINFKDINPYFVLGIINSKLMSFYHMQNSPKAKKGLFPKILVNDVRNLPVKKTPKEKQSTIINFVKQVIEVQAKIQSAKTEADKKTYQQKIEILDKQLDGEVYKLYGLSEEEIKIVEGK